MVTNMRIAVASTNGENVDLHFGKARSLYVYEYDEDEDKFNPLMIEPIILSFPVKM